MEILNRVKSLFYRKKVQLWFSIGFAVGYIYGSLDVIGYLTKLFGNIQLDEICTIFSGFINFVSKTMPNPEFLSDISALLGVMIGISIPFGIEIILKVGERYKSEIILKNFKNEPVVKWLVRSLIIFIIWTVLWRSVFVIYSNDTLSFSYLWPYIAFLTYIYFIIAILLFLEAVSKVKMYALEKENLKDKFACRLVDKTNQDDYLDALEAYGDIAVFEASSSNAGKIIDQSLSFLKRKAVSLVSEEINGDQKILLKPKYFKYFEASSEAEKSIERFDPQSYLAKFSCLLNQIHRIYLKGLERKDDFISRNAVYALEYILAEISSIKNREIFVGSLLDMLHQIMNASIQKNDKSMYAASIHWYTDIIFNGLSKGKDGIEISYLYLFDKYFFLNIRGIISDEKNQIFDSLVSTLIDGIIVPDRNGEFYNYEILVYTEYGKNESLIDELRENEKEIYSQDDLGGWLEKFQELRSNVEHEIDTVKKKEMDRISKDIASSIIQRYKYNNLLSLVFATGAYCLFKRKYYYIRKLWEYKQPADADAHWGGTDINPLTLEELTALYFRVGIFERKFDFWEGHHGSDLYNRRYFILLLARILQNEPLLEGKSALIEKYKLPKLSIYRLSDLEHFISGFKEIATGLKKEDELLLALGFDKNGWDELFDKKITAFLDKVKNEARSSIGTAEESEEISSLKVEEFKDEVLETFEEVATVRDFFKRNKRFEDNTVEAAKGKRLGILTVDEKGAFLNNWHISYPGWGENYGENLAKGENSYLFNEIAENCDMIHGEGEHEKVTEEDIDKKLEETGDLKNGMIFSLNRSLWKFFEKSKNFMPKWHKDIGEKPDYKGFAGYYNYKGNLIPIVEVHGDKLGDQILILNEKSLGRLVQKSPLEDGEDKIKIKGGFYMDVQAFSQNDELKKDFIEKSPEWLNRIGGEKERNEYLNRRVKIDILERIEYEKGEEKGFKISVS